MGGEEMRGPEGWPRMTANPLHTTRRDAAEAPTLLDTKEAAARLGIGKRTLQERVAAREIGHVKIGRSVRFHPDDITAFIERNRFLAVGWKGGRRG
jgi:excisionase family DNA binding protein